MCVESVRPWNFAAKAKPPEECCTVSSLALCHRSRPPCAVITCSSKDELDFMRILPVSTSSARLLWHELTETTDLLLNRPKTWCWIGFCRPDTRRSPSDVDSSN